MHLGIMLRDIRESVLFKEGSDARTWGGSEESQIRFKENWISEPLCKMSELSQELAFLTSSQWMLVGMLLKKQTFVAAEMLLGIPVLHLNRAWLGS